MAVSGAISDKTASKVSIRRAIDFVAHTRRNTTLVKFDNGADGDSDSAKSGSGQKFEVGDSESGDHVSGDSNIELQNGANSSIQVAVRNLFLIVIHNSSNISTDELLEIENVNL